MKETETQIRLRRAAEALKACREAENTARVALAGAMETTRRAKERWEELFHRDQEERVARSRRTT